MLCGQSMRHPIVERQAAGIYLGAIALCRKHAYASQRSRQRVVGWLVQPAVSCCGSAAAAVASWTALQMLYPQLRLCCCCWVVCRHAQSSKHHRQLLPSVLLSLLLVARAAVTHL